MPPAPSPTARYPIPGETSTVFLKSVVANPQIEVGDYTYYHDFDDPLGFERNLRYAFPFEGDRLVIGKFCSIASGATFLLNGGNHRIDGVSSYPFGVFGQGWEAAMPESWPSRGDTIVGHDVWIRYLSRHPAARRSRPRMHHRPKGGPGNEHKAARSGGDRARRRMSFDRRRARVPWGRGGLAAGS
jgi:hypothetical protein